MNGVGGKRKQRSKTPGSGKQAGSTAKKTARKGDDKDWMHALDNRWRREIMRTLHASEEPLSLRQISVSLDQSLQRVTHHMQVLRRREAVALVGAGGGRGSIETFYVSRIKGDKAASCILSQQEDD